MNTQNCRLSVFAAIALLSGSAFAHHGWTWYTGDALELTGSYTAFSVSKPFRLVRQRPNRYLFDRRWDEEIRELMTED